MDAGQVMNVQKETEKLKKLTQKLRETGDITEDEADWIYILRNALQVSYIQKEKEELSLVFCDWYRAVCDRVKSGISGNFLSTVFLDTYMTISFDEMEIINTITHTVCDNDLFNEKAFFQDSEEISYILSKISEDRCLVSDICYSPAGNYGPFLRFPRLGLLRRRSCKKNEAGTTKEYGYLSRLAVKLKYEDVSQEEADNVYLLLRYAQSMAISLTILQKRKKKFYDTEILKKQTKKLFGYLSVWYKAVYEAVKDGRSGNFLSTLPSRRDIYTGSAGVYIKRALKILPENIKYIKFFNDTIPTPLLSFEVSVVKRNMTTGIGSSFRYNGINVDLSKYITIKEETTDSRILHPAYKWLQYLDDKNSYIPQFRIKTPKKEFSCPGFVAKLEALRRNGIYPVVMEKANAERKTKIFIMLHREDYEKARYILDIPDEEIENRAYKIAQEDFFDKNEFEKAFFDAVEVAQNLADIERSRDGYVENAWIPDR